MPTEKPRMSITIDAQDLAVLDRYAAASGTPRATLIAGLVSAVVPELSKAADLIELANAAPRKVVQGMVDDLANATADAMGFLQPFHSSYNTVMTELGSRLKTPSTGRRRGVPGDAPRAAPGASLSRRKRPGDPHLLTGGSK